MGKKYKFNEKCDNYLNNLYKKNKAKTILQKIKVIEKMDEFKDGYSITHFQYGTKMWLKALEYTLLKSGKI